MTVYVLAHHEPYEGCTILGIFQREEDAYRELARMHAAECADGYRAYYAERCLVTPHTLEMP